MYTINKIVGYLISPAGFGMALVVAAVLARVLGKRRLAGWAVLLALANFWLWSTPWMTQWMGAALEAEFLVDGRVSEVESFPQADLIELHGGAMGLATNFNPYAEMWSSADRVWHAARIWKDQVKRRKEKGERRKCGCQDPCDEWIGRFVDRTVTGGSGRPEGCDYL